MIDYNTFKSSLTQLDRLKQFKVPFFSFYEGLVCNHGLLDISDDDMCEFYLVSGDNVSETIVDDYIESIKDVDLEIELTSLKLAKLLALKEENLKNNLKNILNNDNSNRNRR